MTKFELAVDTRLLYQRLAQAKQGETITYAELGKIVSREIGGGDPHLQSAVRKVFHDDGMLFQNIRKVGYKYLEDGEIVDSSDDDLGRGRRHFKRSAARLFSVKQFDTLPPDAKIKHARNASLFGSISVGLSKKTINAIEGAVTVVGRELPVAETLRLFSKS